MTNDTTIAVVGCGYVGLVTAVGLAEQGLRVRAYDRDRARVERSLSRVDRGLNGGRVINLPVPYCPEVRDRENAQWTTLDKAAHILLNVAYVGWHSSDSQVVDSLTIHLNLDEN